MGLNGATDPAVVLRRRDQLAREIGFDSGRALFTVQEHGAFVRAFHRDAPEGGQCVLGTDALATDVPGQALVTYHADCFPVCFLNRRLGLVAAAHAGWRGTLAGVATQTVQAMHLAYGSEPDDLEVLIGPGICASCYQVGRDVADRFVERYGREARYLTNRNGKPQLDLAAAIRLQLEDAGVPVDAIEATGWCTGEDPRWFSHRGGREGRFLAAIVAP